MRRRFAKLAGIGAIALVAMAHVGSPDVYFTGKAGPYSVMVVVRPPGVIPGRAQVLVQVREPVQRVTVQPVFWETSTGGAPDANLIPIPKPVADAAMDAAACIGCGACVAACPNSAAQLFTSAKVSHLNLLPQGQAERYRRVEAMVDTMEAFFGSCTNHGECQEACPKEISIDFIATMNKDYLRAKVKNRRFLSRKP